MVKKLSKLTAWSYSRLALYEQCPRLHKYRNLDKLPEPKGDAMFRGITIHKEAADYLAGVTDIFPQSCEKFYAQFEEAKTFNPIVEQQWAFTKGWKPCGWFDKNAYVRIIADMSIIYGDFTAEVIDHKTGKRYDGDYRPQMGLFAAGLMKKFPEIKSVTTRLWYLDSGDEVIEEFTRAEAFSILEGLETRAAFMLGAERFPPQQSWKCKFCHFRRSNAGPCEF